MASIFSKIIAGEIPSYKVAEDDRYFAFLDIHPVAKGHLLVVPKKEVDKLFDLDAETYEGLFAFCKKVAVGMKKVMPCDRIAMSVIGLEVPHAHVHLIPITTMADMDFTRSKLQLESAEMQSIAERIATAVQL